jgi:hypothetical protein
VETFQKFNTHKTEVKEAITYKTKYWLWGRAAAQTAKTTEHYILMDQNEMLIT